MSKSGKGNAAGTKSASENSSGVGYGRPPERTRFQKGKSGNPGGRPKGSKNLRTLICELADEHVTLITQDGKRLVTIREAAARKFLEMMLKGEFKFFQAFHGLEKLWEDDLQAEKKKQGVRDIEVMQGIIKEFFGIPCEYSEESLHDADEEGGDCSIPVALRK